MTQHASHLAYEERLKLAPTNVIAIVSGANVEENPEVRLYDMSTGKEIARLKLAQSGHMIGFSPDSKTLLIGGTEFVIYDAENGRKVRTVQLLDADGVEHDWNH